MWMGYKSLLSCIHKNATYLLDIMSTSDAIARDIREVRGYLNIVGGENRGRVNMQDSVEPMHVAMWMRIQGRQHPGLDTREASIEGRYPVGS